jgi:hypothetical protein
MSNRFAAFGSLANNVDISRSWENIRKKHSAEDSLGYYVSHKPLFENE